jgi:hypothetical protein
MDGGDVPPSGGNALNDFIRISTRREHDAVCLKPTYIRQMRKQHRWQLRDLLASDWIDRDTRQGVGARCVQYGNTVSLISLTPSLLL